ncbi:MAG: carboxypeptidase-like regulatory domain-containing protein [Cyclobacteriaceae bacterium]
MLLKNVRFKFILKQILFTLLSLTSLIGLAQKTRVSGKVTEAESGTPIPFANVVFIGTQEGAITDFEGNFVAETSLDVSELEVRYIGFIKRSKPVQLGADQVINFQLEEDVQTLGEVVVYAGENPAWKIMRGVVANKELNDKRALSAYEYESYTKVEFDVDNISDKFRKRKVVQKITNVLDSIEQIAGEDGKPILPVFLSEAISRYYYKKDPTFRHENIIKTKVSAVGITDGTLTSQVIGSTFQEYNFYQNWLNIVTKEFVSPLADGWKLYYEVYLEDSLYLEDHFCYRIDFYPKREQDLAFIGTMWISKDDYALKRIDATVPRSANLNYIEKVKIQQDLFKTEAGPWLPEKTRVVVDVAQVTKQTAGMLAKFYVSTRDHIVNDPKPNKFYLNPVVMEEDVRDYTDEFWEANRHDSLSSTEINVFSMIDSMKKIPVVKTYMDLAKFAVNGYYKIGSWDVGPYATFFGKNNIEGTRIGFGARSTIDISRKWTFGGHIGYGFDDEQFKYRFFADRILSRQPWTNIRYEQQKEVEQIWLLNDQIEPNSLFYSLSRFGTLTQPFLSNKYRLSVFRQISAGFGGSIAFKHQTYDPYFNFNYFKEPGDTETFNNYEVTEVTLSARFSKDEVFAINDNERISLGTRRWPAFNVDYTYGLKNVLSSDFSYHKFKLSVQKNQKMGLLGKSKIRFTGGYILGDLPYTMLYNTIGNETFFYVDFAYNLMDFFEFSTDKYLEFRYRHQFEGFVLNTIPVMKKLKWRLIGSTNILYGDLSDTNIGMTQHVLDSDGNPILPFSQFQNKPYIEMGYGIENIFKIFSVEAFHRLTYLDAPDVRKFGLKFNIQVIL